MNNENKATFNCGCNTPLKVLGEIPASPVKNQAHRKEPLNGSKKFRVRRGTPEFRLVEEGVRGTSSSLPVKQESCTGSAPNGGTMYINPNITKFPPERETFFCPF